MCGLEECICGEIQWLLAASARQGLRFAQVIFSTEGFACKCVAPLDGALRGAARRVLNVDVESFGRRLRCPNGCLPGITVSVIEVASSLVTTLGEFSGGFPSTIETSVAVVLTASSVYPFRLRISEPKRVATRY